MTPKEIGASVRATRKAQQLDQVLLANLAGVSDRFVRDLEHGKPTVQLEQCLRVIDVLGLELRIEPRR